jgi:lipoprotein-anchoring transpeptidase ErfK/SrfK
MKNYSRREFLKISAFSLGALAFRPWVNWKQMQSDFPDAEQLGRNCAGGWITLRARPTTNSPEVERVYEDSVVVWLREVIGEAAGFARINRWIETPKGYLYAPNIQPVKNIVNKPVTELPTSGLGKGMWAEVTVPYVDLYLDRPACSPWLKEATSPRLYYSQVMWIDDVITNSQGQILYRVNELYGNCGDIFWAAAEGFRPITKEEIEPIHPDVENKRVVVDLNHQVLSCYEGNDEVYFCTVSTGAKYDAQGNVVEKWATPPGKHLPWRKSISIHMAGNSTGVAGGWDTAGVPWSVFFDPNGAAIHSTFWHNAFGDARSHGCVNARPEDAKWIFRWTSPHVPYDPGDIDLTGQRGTIVDVIEA